MGCAEGPFWVGGGRRVGWGVVPTGYCGSGWGGALQEDDDEIIIKRVRQRLGRCLAGAGSDILVGTVTWMKFKETRSSSA